MPNKTPSLSDLYQLAEQLENDARMPVQSARQRDHALAAQCQAADDVGRLQYWLAAVASQRSSTAVEPWLSEASAGALGRLLALCFGFAGMATFLLASGRGLVNVFMFLLLFVAVQLLLCLVAAVVLLRGAAGQQPVMLPLNPARLLVARALPDRRYLREAQSVLRLLFMRYGQELGAIFTLGAIAAFFVVLALSNFTFVWGSTFQLSDTLVEQVTALLATPWSAWLPTATVSGELIFASRFHPATSTLGPADIAAMRGWWPFLIMCMLFYAMLPRFLLWLLSRGLYRRHVRAAFVRLPGSERVLARMKAPLVKTQGAGRGAGQARPVPDTETDPQLLLLNWADALVPEDSVRFEAFAAVPAANIVNAGLGSLPEELTRLAGIFDGPVQHVCVVVKSWEPPMADLADFLARFSGVSRCTLWLLPLGKKAVSAERLGDWQVFARTLAFPAVDVQVLESA